MEYGTTGNGYAVWSGTWEGVSDELNKPGSDALAQIIQQQLEGVSKISEAVGAIGNSSLKAAYDAAFAANRTFVIKRHWEDEEINLQEFLESVPGLFQEQMYKVLSAVDLSGLATAADGAIADTFDEVSDAITDAMSFVALGANLGEYQDDFNAAISGKLLEALNQMDTSGIGLDIDKSSLAGWEAAAKALQAWDEIDAALQGVINPTSELTTTLNTATAQFDSWIERLRDLGWYESEIAKVEERRAQYMFEYANALKRATEQDLNLRVLALRYGSDSSEYGLQSLQYKQQNELAELAKKFGKDSDIYNQAVKVQQAELLKYQLDMLLSQKDQLLSEEIASQRDLASSLDDLVKALEEARTNLWTGEDNLTGSRFEDSLANFNRLYASAMGEDQEALRELPTAATELLDLGRDNLSSWQEYNDLFYDVDQKLKAAQDNAEEQYDASKAQLNALGKMVEQGDNVQMILDDILAQIEEIQNALSGKLDELTGGGSLNQREALIQAKVNQLNDMASEGRTDWTADSFLSYMYREGLTLQSWYDKYGKYENLGVDYDSGGGYDSILENKAAQLNAQASDGRKNWTPSEVAKAIAEAGMTIDEWYKRYGLQEGIGDYGKRPSDAFPSDPWRSILEAKAASLNRGENLEGTKSTAGGWTADKVADAIKAEGMTIEEWYDRFGKLEGFASGGITPVNRPFWVGENGPELVVSPRQYGVLSNEQSMNLIRNEDEDGDGHTVASVIREGQRQMYDVLRQMLTKLDSIYGQNRRIVRNLDTWNAEGVPLEA